MDEVCARADCHEMRQGGRAYCSDACTVKEIHRAVSEYWRRERRRQWMARRARRFRNQTPV